jgi:hypothetical protein
MGIKHAFTSAKSDPTDATLIRPSNWNADHTGGVTTEEFNALVARVLVLETGTPGTSPGYFGPRLGTAGIGNYQVGGTNISATVQIDYRFRAKTTSTLTHIQFCQTNGTGYWGGTGGMVEITVQTDNGSGDPSGTVIATYTYTPVNQAGYWPKIAFASPPSLTAGTLYHVCFRNTDANPATNFCSLNNHFIKPAMDAVDMNPPRYPSTDWGSKVRTGPGATWYVSHPEGDGYYYPQFAVFYADATVDGVCFSYVVSVKETLPATEVFTTTTPITVTAVGLLVDGTITVRLENSLHTEIETVTVTGSGPRWGWTNFLSSHDLNGTYYLVVSGTGTIRCMYKGTAYGSWPASTGFAEGYQVGYATHDLPFALKYT